jgi:hypothetical protein
MTPNINRTARLARADGAARAACMDAARDFLRARSSVVVEQSRIAVLGVGGCESLLVHQVACWPARPAASSDGKPGTFFGRGSSIGRASPSKCEGCGFEPRPGRHFCASPGGPGMTHAPRGQARGLSYTPRHLGSFPKPERNVSPFSRPPRLNDAARRGGAGFSSWGGT